MYYKRVYGYEYKEFRTLEAVAKGRLDTFVPRTHKSLHWKAWRTVYDEKLCPRCLSQCGKIYAKSEAPQPKPPLHPNCRCAILPMKAVSPGGATKDGENGADFWLALYGQLPDYYITEQELINSGWKYSKPIASKAPGKMLFGGIYENNNGHLPSAPERVWYEADINYYEGHRNSHRVLFSNDGLILVTYDHYKTFYEIRPEE